MNIVLHWPQYIWLTFMFLSLLGNTMKWTQGKVDNWQFVGTLLGIMLCILLLYQGGFFMGVSP